MLNISYMCVLLGSAAKPVLWDFFKKYPNAESARQADWSELASMLNPLGLHEKRAQIIIRFSGIFMHSDHNNVIQLCYTLSQITDLFVHDPFHHQATL